MSRPINLFFAYSRQDEKLRDELAKRLRAMERNKLIAGWHDRQIRAGEDWAQAIAENLRSADIILLLVSPDFLNSDFCAEVELKQAMERHAAGEACVIPVILRPLHWQDEPFARLQVLPTNGDPITTWNDRDEAFLDVDKGIRGAVQRLKKGQTVEQIGQEEVVAQTVEETALPLVESTLPIWTRREFLIAGGIGSIAVTTSLAGIFWGTVGRSNDKLRDFDFEVVTVNAQGEIIGHQPKQTKYFMEGLGNGVMVEMVEIPGGEFVMGSPDQEAERASDEGPQHTVKVPAFFMGKFAVTQAQWAAVAKLPKVKIDLNADPSNFKGAKQPVENVSWLEAVEFCDRLSQKTGRVYRLPSEAEWEYACRAGTKTPFYFGETITTDLVNFNGTYTYASAPKGQYREQTTEVGSFPANAFGLYDMHGNVMEWCLDHWHDSYDGAPTNGSAWLSNNDGTRRLLRGGSWFFDLWDCRSADRFHGAPGIRNFFVGFRCVCDRSRTL